MKNNVKGFEEFNENLNISESKKKVEITLDEEDVQEAIREYVEKHYKLSVKNIKMRTAVKGDYDRGNAVEYVKKVWCECDTEH
jgi:Arc/MetJ family transcription regulator